MPGGSSHARVPRWEEAFIRLVLRFARSARTEDGRARAGGVLLIFLFAERLATLGHHKRALSAGGVLSYEIEPFSGRPLPLGAGQQLRPGEPVAILHWQNRHGLARLAEPAAGRHANSFRLAALARADLRSLADMARCGALSPDVRAVWAETILYPLLALYGFHTRSAAPGVRTRLLRIYFLGLLASYGLAGLAHARGGRPGHYELGEAWLSVDDLCERFPAPLDSG
jgi:hypothetical protein